MAGQHDSRLFSLISVVFVDVLKKATAIEGAESINGVKKCKVGLQSGSKSAGPLCCGTMSHEIVGTDHVREAGLTDKDICTQMNDARDNDQIDSKAKPNHLSKLGNKEKPV